MSHFGNTERAENIFQEKLGEIEREYPDLPEEEQEEKAAKRTQEQLEKLRELAEASLTKTEELHKVLAQIEALMSREEMQKVSKKHK